MARIGIYGARRTNGGHCAATVEHDGGALREWVEGFARFDPERPPGDEPTRRWLLRGHSRGVSRSARVRDAEIRGSDDAP